MGSFGTFVLTYKCLSHQRRTTMYLSFVFSVFCFFFSFQFLLVPKPPEVLIQNGHFSWKQPEEPGEEEPAFTTAGDLTNIDFCIETVSNTFSNFQLIIESKPGLHWF